MLNFSAFIADRTKDFTGREWVFGAIDRWLANPDLGRVFLLTGGPGSGKSAIAARLAQMSLGEVRPGAHRNLGKGRLAYFHFCQGQADATVNPLRFVESLSAALANRYPPFAEALLKTSNREITVVQDIGTAAKGSHITGVTIESLHIGNLSARAAFDWAVRRPLEALCMPGFDETVVILVDSMDEALAYNPDENIPQLLADAAGSPQNLPGKVRFLLTSRPDPLITGMLGEPTLDLVVNAPEDADEVYAYAKHRLGAAPTSADLARRIADAGKGNFLYARYVLDELSVHPEALADPTTLALPDGLDDVYRQFILRELGRNRERWDERYRPILGMLTVARGQGLTRAQLAALANQFYGLLESRANDALDRCFQYLVGPQPDGPFNIYHKSFREFLTKDSELQVYPAEANQALGTFFLGEYDGNWLDCQDRYALEHTPAHLTAAVAGMTAQRNRRALSDKLGALLNDFDYLEAKTWRFGVGSLLTDLQTATGTLSVYDEFAESLSPMLKAVGAEAVSLANWDRAQNIAFFAQQVGNRATVLGLAKLSSEAAIRLARLNRPYIQLIWHAELVSNTQETTQQGRVDVFQAGAFTPFGRWPVRIMYDESAATGVDIRGRVTRSLDITELILETPSRTWEFIVPRDGSPIEGPPEITFHWHFRKVGPGGRFTGVRFKRMVLNDASVFTRDWESYVMQTPVAMTSDRRWAFAALRDGRIRILNAETGQEQVILAGHSALVTSLTATHDGRHLVSGSIDGTIKVWDLNTNLEEHLLVGHSGPIAAIAIAQSGSLIVSASTDGTLKVWDMATGYEKWTLSGHGGPVHTVALMQNGQTAISASADRTLKVWNLVTGREMFTLDGHDGPVLSMALTPDGQYAVSASQDGTLRIWNLGSRQAEHVLSGHTGAVHTVLMTPDVNRVISAADDGTLRVWDMATGHEVRSLTVDGLRPERTLDTLSDDDAGPGFEPFALQLICGGAHLAVTRWWCDRLEVWDISASDSPSPVTFTVMDHDLGHIAWQSDGNTVLTCDDTGAVCCLRYMEPRPKAQG